MLMCCHMRRRLCSGVKVCSGLSFGQCCFFFMNGKVLCLRGGREHQALWSLSLSFTSTFDLCLCFACILRFVCVCVLLRFMCVLCVLCEIEFELFVQCTVWCKN